MNTKTTEEKFISTLKALRETDNAHIKELDAYKYVKDCLVSENMMSNHFYSGLNDIHYVRKDIAGKTLIDAGCGAGSFSILLSLLGANKVYAVDFIPDCLEMTEAMAGFAGLDDIETVQSDIGELDLPGESVDGIFSLESISHYRDYTSFLKNASRLLKKGGFLVIRDGNNGASPFTKKMNYKIWEIFENHPHAITISGHIKGDSCYLDERKKIIREEFSSLSEEKIDEFAKNTFSYSKEKIIEAVNQFIMGDFSLKSEYATGKCPKDPVTDCYMELLFHPKDLMRELKDYGFQSKLYAAGPSRKSLRVLKFLYEFLTPITIYLPRAFKIISRKMN